MFLHFDDIDHAGHEFGYGTGIPQYVAALRKVDAEVGTVLSAIHNRRNHANEQWLVLVTTDHGGIGMEHGGQSAGERIIFIIASGGGVAHRVISPGPGQTAIAPTVFAYLDIPIHPEWGWESKPFGLAASAAKSPQAVNVEARP